MTNPQPPIDERRQAWAYLSRVFEGPSRELTNLLNNGCDPEAIARGIRRRESWLGDILARTHTRYQDDRAKADLATMAAIGGRLVTPDDPEWPAEPLDAAFRFAASGKSDTLRSYQEDAVPPHALWVRGSNLRQLCAQAVSIVGSRAASNYGSHAARLISAGLIDHHWTIISGGAFGIDSAAHTEVLARGGTTIAVQACGLDRPYPRRHPATAPVPHPKPTHCRPQLRHRHHRSRLAFRRAQHPKLGRRLRKNHHGRARAHHHRPVPGLPRAHPKRRRGHGVLRRRGPPTPRQNRRH